MITIDKSKLDVIEKDLIYEHLSDLYSTRAPPPNRGLGYISRASALPISVGTIFELQVEQSVSLFNDSNNNNGSTTGWLTWSISPLMVEWLLECEPNNPFYNKFEKSTVVELGSGISGLLGCTLALKCSKFICTDQAPLLKLLKRNIFNNVSNIGSTTIIELNNHDDKKKPLGKLNKIKKTKQDIPMVEVVEYDWEETYNDEILRLLDNDYPDFLITCDTVYNPYLIPHLVNAMDNLSNRATHVIVGLQLREESLLQTFLEEATEKFEVYSVNDDILSDELRQGYGVYYLTKKGNDPA
ncbi:hypothetical protein CANARDRAFT_23414 [[Candida] arabinofermentans NRRL YB-2248]|uniref:Ribosomal lysine N-methyltransferase 5 n=1 Tax=[Candida] arabinofermentans NRRL YB-2248 TaxID=983967 RepID=A0A1E4T0R0_9ASCO|nr:hypothetical protein CANARDRAFT_23414 [[Candida] arabinofermentans NRRL YB-2248]